ncbi:delta-like protein C isoform X1 [Neoarius graeffei]|uniref:delta-like protein C isoform X1 n=2 Tax=Neoarius graeffei TaxID=443677 RepID=UPI00298CF4FF|nr:delta-like protein C isoform X1 [Neoarius graeffei]
MRKLEARHQEPVSDTWNPNRCSLLFGQTMRKMAHFFSTCIFIVIGSQLVHSSGVFELKVHSYSSPGGVCKDSQDCRIFFRVCLKHSQDVISAEPPCTYGTGLTDTFSAEPSSIASSAPIKVPFNFKWPGTFSLIIEAWNTAPSSDQSTETQNTRLSLLATKRSLTAGENSLQDERLGEQSELRYSYHVMCDEFYYGESCSVFCRPRDDAFGHFTCDSSGQRICLSGWKGEYCGEPICSPGCSDEHGYCETPGECKCRLGWEGPLCDECQRHPGCLHGTCDQPFQCDCKEGWGGLFCNQDLNFCTNHKPCKNDATCTNTGQGSYTCACKPGFSGTNCELETNECNSNPCKNGGSCNDLVNDYSCTCPQGFYGKNCEVSAMTCADGPCFNGGTCMETPTGSYSCRCPVGYMGSNCEKKIDRCSSDPCANGGQCLDLGHSLMCRCRPGFKGLRCEINIDECARNPCRNAGTCVDGINDYTCKCTLGFTGKDCNVRTDACSLLSCRNGATCYFHFSGPVCNCPPGFMGLHCEYSQPSTKPPPVSSFPAVLAISSTLVLITLMLVLCAAIILLKQMRRGNKFMFSSVRNNLDTINNRSSVISNVQSSYKEKEAFLIPGGPFKVSNKDAALNSGILDTLCNDKANNKQKMLDYNLAKDEKNTKDKLDLKNSESSILVSSLSFPKEDLYHPVYILPEQKEPCVFATEMNIYTFLKRKMNLMEQWK